MLATVHPAGDLCCVVSTLVLVTLFPILNLVVHGHGDDHVLQVIWVFFPSPPYWCLRLFKS